MCKKRLNLIFTKLFLMYIQASYKAKQKVLINETSEVYFPVWELKKKYFVHIVMIYQIIELFKYCIYAIYIEFTELKIIILVILSFLFYLFFVKILYFILKNHDLFNYNIFL